MCNYFFGQDYYALKEKAEGIEYIYDNRFTVDQILDEVEEKKPFFSKWRSLITGSVGFILFMPPNITQFTRYPLVMVLLRNFTGWITPFLYGPLVALMIHLLVTAFAWTMNKTMFAMKLYLAFFFCLAVVYMFGYSDYHGESSIFSSNIPGLW